MALKNLTYHIHLLFLVPELPEFPQDDILLRTSCKELSKQSEKVEFPPNRCSELQTDVAAERGRSKRQVNAN